MSPVVHLLAMRVLSTKSGSSAPKILASRSSFLPTMRLNVLMAKSVTLALLLFSCMAVMERMANLRAMSISLASSSLIDFDFFFFLDLERVRFSPQPGPWVEDGSES